MESQKSEVTVRKYVNSNESGKNIGYWYIFTYLQQVVEWKGGLGHGMEFRCTIFLKAVKFKAKCSEWIPLHEVTGKMSF